MSMYLFSCWYELNRITKRSFRFVQDIGVRLFDEQIKQEYIHIDDRVRGKKILLMSIGIKMQP